MSVVLSDLTTKVRYLLEDNVENGVDVYSYTTSDVFSLQEAYVVSVTDVLNNGVSLGSGLWEYSSSTNKVTITGSSGISSGDTIEINYTYYPNYSDSIIEKYVQASLIHISANNYKDFIVESSEVHPEPTEREKNLISLIASILVNPDNRSYNLPEVRIGIPKDIPTKDKISKTIAIFKKDSTGVFSIL